MGSLSLAGLEVEYQSAEAKKKKPGHSSPLGLTAYTLNEIVYLYRSYYFSKIEQKNRHNLSFLFTCNT